MPLNSDKIYRFAHYVQAGGPHMFLVTDIILPTFAWRPWVLREINLQGFALWGSRTWPAPVVYLPVTRFPWELEIGAAVVADALKEICYGHAVKSSACDCGGRSAGYPDHSPLHARYCAQFDDTPPKHAETQEELIARVRAARPKLKNPAGP